MKQFRTFKSCQMKCLSCFCLFVCLGFSLAINLLCSNLQRSTEVTIFIFGRSQMLSYSKLRPQKSPTDPMVVLEHANECFTFQSIQLNTGGMVVPAPVVRRPYDSMESPYSSSCSRLCNHPVSKDIKREYRDAMKKAKDSHVSCLSSGFHQPIWLL